MKNAILFTMSLALLTACGATEDEAAKKTKERAAAEAAGTIDAEKKNQAEKAAQMEQDLAARHAYYRSMTGEFAGELTTSRAVRNISFNIFPSIPPYTGGRVRQLSEIEADLNNLFLFVQVKQWPKGSNNTVSCRIGGIRPNLSSGQISLASTECANVYQVFLADEGTENLRLTADRRDLANRDAVASRATGIAGALRGGSRIDRFVGVLRPSTLNEVYTFDMRRTQ